MIFIIIIIYYRNGDIIMGMYVCTGGTATCATEEGPCCGSGIQQSELRSSRGISKQQWHL